MTPIRRHYARVGAALVAALGIAGLLPVVPASAQSDLQARLLRLERDMRDLQAETFRRGQGGNLPLAGAGSLPTPEGSGAGAPDLDPLMRRLDELQEGLGRLTGQMEELGHQVDQLTQRSDRMQRELDYQAKQQAAAAPPPDGADAPDNEVASATPPRPGPNAPILRPYAPPALGVLGQIPSNAPLPRPSPQATQGGDARQEFDSAMNLLSRAQYDQASQAFRSFIDAHPQDTRTPAALYWTGDIAFSAKKDYTEAARDFAELLKKYPNAPRAPEGMLKLGLSLFELGQTKEGCSALAALPAKYPDAPAAVATRARNERRDNKCA